ncbi:MAG: hypothetical protein COV66_01090 [Nitrospinae bacterium CG11_big_fil_rev_8_21_14_0_20_45_15]|nr:MAG: hypothetical protein COV66_01090 [Nitrospinae bacterium CG11_big_fil_rev_8_21_14_0_20_45_15]
MDFSITPTPRVFKSYQTQERYAELNKKISVKIVQGQVDTVNISSKAREYLEKGPPAEEISYASMVSARKSDVDKTTEDNTETDFQPFDFGSNEFSPVGAMADESPASEPPEALG